MFPILKEKLRIHARNLSGGQQQMLALVLSEGAALRRALDRSCAGAAPDHPGVSQALGEARHRCRLL